MARAKSKSKSKPKATQSKPTQSKPKAKAKVTNAKARPKAKATSKAKASGTAKPGAAKTRSIAELVAAYEKWCAKHAKRLVERLSPPASPEMLAALQQIGDIPEELIELLQLHDGGMHFFEYDLMSCERMLERRAGLENLRQDGVFDSHEVFSNTAKIVQRVKWHTGWLPLFQDGGGNLYFMDLAPDTNGRVGQIVQWESRGGPGARKSWLLADVLERYVQALEARKLKYDDTFGIMDAGNRSERFAMFE